MSWSVEIRRSVGASCISQTPIFRRIGKALSKSLGTVRSNLYRPWLLWSGSNHQELEGSVNPSPVGTIFH